MKSRVVLKRALPSTGRLSSDRRSTGSGRCAAATAISRAARAVASAAAGDAARSTAARTASRTDKGPGVGEVCACALSRVSSSAAGAAPRQRRSRRRPRARRRGRWKENMNETPARVAPICIGRREEMDRARAVGAGSPARQGRADQGQRAAGGRQGWAAGAANGGAGLAIGMADVSTVRAEIGCAGIQAAVVEAPQSAPVLHRWPVAAKVCRSLQQSGRPAGSRSPAASMACIVASIGQGDF